MKTIYKTRIQLSESEWEEKRVTSAWDEVDAAEQVAQEAFDNWAWECTNDAYPMKIEVDGEMFIVELEVVPSFYARKAK